MNQKQRILEGDAPLHLVAGIEYKGCQPLFADININVPGKPVRIVKIQKGVPFVRTKPKQRKRIAA